MRYYTPKGAYVFNELSRSCYRNLPCACGSFRKIKKCCGRSKYIDKEFAELFSFWLMKNSLVKPKCEGEAELAENAYNELLLKLRDKQDDFKDAKTDGSAKY